MIKDYFSLAFGSLKHRGLRSWLTMLGIFIGIAAVVSLITMGQGLQATITGQFGGLAVDRLTIQNKGTGFGPPGSTVVNKLNEHDLEVIKSVSGIERVVTQLIRVVNIEYNKVGGYSYITDIPEDKSDAEYVYSSGSIEIEQGKLLIKGDYDKVVLGHGFIEREDFGKKIEVGRSIIIDGKNFQIVGILKKSSSFAVNDAILIMNGDLEKLLNIQDKKEYDIIAVQVKDKNRIEQVASEIERKLRQDRHEKLGEESFSVQTPLQALSSANTILDVVNIIVIGIAAISLFIGGIGIANTMYASVLERTKEIGVMKAIGAKNKDIMIIFLIEAGLLGLVGGIVGATMGVLGALTSASVANQALGGDLFKVTISFPLIFGAIAFSFLVGVLSGTLPAFQASKLNVVDALRK